MNRLLFLLMIFPCLGFSQLEHQQTVQTDNFPKKMLYKKTVSWIEKTPLLSKKVLKLSDPDSGLLLINSDFEYNCKLRNGSKKHSGNISFNLEIRIKDSSFDYKMYAFKHPAQGVLYDSEQHPGEFTSDSERKYYDLLWKDILNQTKSQINEISKSLEKSLLSPIPPE